MRTVLLLAGLALVAGCKKRDGDLRTVPDDTGVSDDDTGSPIDTGDTEDTEDTQPSTDEACYPGSDDSWTSCLPVVAPANMPSGYDYPPPYNGSTNYRAPEAWLDLAALDPDERLAPNFVLSEFAEEYKGRYAVVQPHAVDRLQDVRDALGALVVNSGYRNVDYNAGVGGATYSRHMYGDAFDLDPSAATLSELQAECLAEGAGFVSVYATHVHCDWRDDPVDTTFYGPANRAAPLDAWPVVDAEITWTGELLTAPADGFDEGEPYRVWTAFDASDRRIAEATGSAFAPPDGTARVEVEVGGLLQRSLQLR